MNDWNVTLTKRFHYGNEKVMYHRISKSRRLSPTRDVSNFSFKQRNHRGPPVGTFLNVKKSSDLQDVLKGRPIEILNTKLGTHSIA